MRPQRNDNGVLWLIAIVALVWWLSNGDASPIIAPAPTVSRVVYVFEKDDGPVPSPVSAALNALNRRDIVATTWDDDTTDGEGEVPDQYKVPLEESRKAGTPLLVVLNGDEVIRVVKAPTTLEQIEEATR
jgi:hypothetical protein